MQDTCTRVTDPNNTNNNNQAMRMCALDLDEAQDFTVFAVKLYWQSWQKALASNFTPSSSQLVLTVHPRRPSNRPNQIFTFGIIMLSAGYKYIYTCMGDSCQKPEWLKQRALPWHESCPTSPGPCLFTSPRFKLRMMKRGLVLFNPNQKTVIRTLRQD